MSGESEGAVIDKCKAEWDDEGVNMFEISQQCFSDATHQNWKFIRCWDSFHWVERKLYQKFCKISHAQFSGENFTTRSDLTIIDLPNLMTFQCKTAWFIYESWQFSHAPFSWWNYEIRFKLSTIALHTFMALFSVNYSDICWNLLLDQLLSPLIESIIKRPTSKCIMNSIPSLKKISHQPST